MKIFTDEAIRPAHLPVVPLLQAIGCRRTEHDDWWEQHAPGGDLAVSSRHELVTDLAEADILVIPLDWYWVRGNSWASRTDRRLAARCAELAEIGRSRGLPVVVFFTGDRSCDRVGLDGVVVFREGGYRSRSGPLDRSMPAFIDDLIAVHLGQPTILDRPSRPTVGFCGLAAQRSGPRVRLREAAAVATSLVHNRAVQPSQFTGENLRHDAIGRLARHSGIETDFVVRATSVFFGGPSDASDVRRQFVENLDANAYSLCIRGSGNYSYRLYETMSLGRIPVIIDTDLMLPRADVIAWPEVAVWVEPGDLDVLGEAVIAFHERLSADDFVDLQRMLRQLWHDYLRPQAWLAELEQALATVAPETPDSARPRQ